MEEIIKAIFDAVTGLISNFGTGIVKFVASNVDFLNQPLLFGMLTTNTSWSAGDRMLWLATLHQRVIYFAWLLLLLKAIFDGIRFYVAREAGETTIAPSVLFHRVVYSIGLMTITTYYFAYGHHGISGAMMEQIKHFAPHYSSLPNDPQSNPIYTPGQDKWAPDMKIWLEQFNTQWVSRPAHDPGEAAIRNGIGMTVALGVFAFYIQGALRDFELVFAWLISPVVCLSPLSTDDPFREGAFSMWLREVIVISFSYVTMAITLILMRELVHFDPAHPEYWNGSNPAREWLSVLIMLVLTTLGTQGPRVLRQYAWGNSQAQGIASQLMKLPF